MPQRSPYPLVYILLIWTSILSIVLLSFITISFTQGQSSNSSTVGHTSQLHSTPFSSRILNFRAKECESPKSNIEWDEITPTELSIEKQRGQKHYFQLMEDGNYIINLRVTLSPYKRNPNAFYSVALKMNGITRLISWIDTQSNSTGLLSKILFLAKATEVEITIEPPACINHNLTVSHLDILLM